MKTTDKNKSGWRFVIYIFSPNKVGFVSNVKGDSFNIKTDITVAHEFDCEMAAVKFAMENDLVGTEHCSILQKRIG